MYSSNTNLNPVSNDLMTNLYMSPATIRNS